MRIPQALMLVITFSYPTTASHVENVENLIKFILQERLIMYEIRLHTLLTN